MLLLGLILIGAGALVIVATVFTAEIDGRHLEVLGVTVSPLALFLLGVGAGLAVLWGFGILKYGTKRSLRQRRESKKLEELSEKLEIADRERHRDNDDADHDRS
ncbi:hypothetical protein [Nocardioides lianchengensis]|uniref:Lipopolysaccharide assembly protein A domain-containing protein n=1 Tax=Nocardioides lianchengensis TaxID=1045774 RepID=A0A1G6PXJ0_9ACTN|nr:hypothetical protein [Nocardioides lianchengensis]NYG11995.1 hypothetical protein [Nocardioides lianchengensis]SDC84095.1 hypothetical protein SAMN05421872_104163 [Nocardioides lianchengensis]